MNPTTKLIILNTLSVICALASALLASEGNPRFGWFLAVALLTHTSCK